MKLSLCATPIGNLEDITLRVIRTLQQADIIAAEDTRHTLKLLNHLGISKPLISCHQHNERQSAEVIVAHIQAGRHVAYVSDAGMPGISDPGALLLQTVREAGLPVEVLPGASALIMAVALCGLASDRFFFEGFLPRKGKQRQQRIEELSSLSHTILLYESPLRVVNTLTELRAALGNRNAALMRELTKLHEQTLQGTIEELLARCANTPPRGECVIAIEGAAPAQGENVSSEQIDAMLRACLEKGLSTKDAVRQTAAHFQLPRNKVYARALSEMNPVE